MLCVHVPLYCSKDHGASLPHTCSPAAVTEPLSVGLSGGLGSPARSVFDPYDTTSLHIFIREAFPGAILLEEHQVDLISYSCSIEC